MVTQIKPYAALLMFQSGWFSHGAACEFASVHIDQFLQACKLHHFSVMDTTAEAVEVDVLRFQQRPHSMIVIADVPITFQEIVLISH
jgi:hypothetical protein